MQGLSGKNALYHDVYYGWSYGNSIGNNILSGIKSIGQNQTF